MTKPYSWKRHLKFLFGRLIFNDFPLMRASRLLEPLSQFFSASHKTSRPIRNIPNLFALEDRLVPAQVLFESPAATSYPTIWGDTPSGSSPDVATFTQSLVVITKDYQGNLIDFNQDGRGDFINLGNAIEVIDYIPAASTTFVANFAHFGNAYVNTQFNGPQVVTPSKVFSGTVNSSPLATVAVVDLNEDGYQDILNIEVANGSVSKYLWDPVQSKFGNTRISLPNVTVPAGNASSYGHLQLRDLNGDNIPDMVVPFFTTPSSRSDVHLLTSFGVYFGKAETNGKWIGAFDSTLVVELPLTTISQNIFSTTRLGSNNGPCSVDVNPQLGDFNGDGSVDVAIPDGTGIRVFLNPGNGVFVANQGISFNSVNNSPGANLVLGDLNSDGLPDLVSSSNYYYANINSIAGPLTIYLNTSQGNTLSFTTNSQPGHGSGYSGALNLADLNQDGKLDLIVAPGVSRERTVVVYEGMGNGSFGADSNFLGYSNVDAYYQSDDPRAIMGIGISDINDDSLLDLVIVANNQEDKLTVGITGISINDTFQTPKVTPTSLTDATTGQNYSLQLAHTGGNPDRSYIYSLNPNSVRLPAGLTLSQSGLLSGNPTQAGYYQLLVDINQPNGMSGSTLVGLRVNSASPGVLTISPATIPNAVAGIPYNQQLTTSGATGTLVYSVSTGQLPSGLTLSSGGLIAGSPTSTGVSTFTVSVLDSAGTIGYRPYSITVTTNPSPPLARPSIIAGSGEGGLVTIFNADGTPRLTFAPFGTSYKGGVNVAQGDINRDGVEDLVVAAGSGGGPHVIIYNGQSLAVMQSFFAYSPSFTGGVSVATGDVDGDGQVDIVTGPGFGGGPHVEVFNGSNLQLMDSFFAFDPNFLGGVNVATGDLNNDLKADIIVGAGPTGGPHVKTFSGADLSVLSSFMAYSTQFTGGVYVTSGDVNNDGALEIITGPGKGGGPNVRVFNGQNGTMLSSFFAFGLSNTGGVNVSAADLNNDGSADIVAALASQGATISTFNGLSLAQIQTFLAFSNPVGASVSAK